MRTNVAPLRRQQRADGHQARDQPRGDGGEDPARLRRRRETTTPSALGSAFSPRTLEQRVYDPDKAKHYPQAGPDWTRSRWTLSVADAAFAGAVDAGALFAESAKAAGNHSQPHSRAERRLLVQRVEHEALLRVLLGRASRRGPDVLDRVRGRTAVERHRVGARAVQTCCSKRPGRRVDEAKRARDVCRDAAARARRGAGLSSRCSPRTSSPPPRKSLHLSKWARTGTSTASAGWNAGRSHDPQPAGNRSTGAARCRAGREPAMRGKKHPCFSKGSDAGGAARSRHAMR